MPPRAWRNISSIRFRWPPNATVSGYWPTADEADPLPLLGTLRARGHAVALPRVAGKSRTPLAFHIYGEDVALLPGRMGLFEPGTDWTRAIPSVLIVPLLAFDARGHRLGYGAGYYDATLADLRRSHGAVAVGYAYEGQEVHDVPHDEHDQRLDWIVTENGSSLMRSIWFACFCFSRRLRSPPK